MADPYKLRKGTKIVVREGNEIIRGKFGGILRANENSRNQRERVDRIIVNGTHMVSYVPVPRVTVKIDRSILLRDLLQYSV